MSQLLVVAVVVVPTVGVDLDLRPHLAAYQVVIRLPARLFDNIPQYGFDSRHGRIHDGARVVFNLIQIKPEILDIEGIVANDVSVAEIQDQFADGGLFPAQCALTPTHQTCVGGQLDEDKVELLSAHQKYFHFVDLHVISQQS